MIVRLVKLYFRKEEIENAKMVFAGISEKVRAQPGCSFLEINQTLHKPHIFFTHSHWISEEDLNNYRHSEYFKEVWGSLKPLFGQPAEAWSTKRFRYHL